MGRARLRDRDVSESGCCRVERRGPALAGGTVDRGNHVGRFSTLQTSVRFPPAALGGKSERRA